MAVLLMITVCNKLARTMRQKLVPTPPRVGMVISGYGVPHVHYILVPTLRSHDVTSQVYAALKDGEIVFAEEHIPLADPAEQERLAALLRQS